MTSSSIENLKWCHFQTLLLAVVVRELGPRQILVPTSLVFHDAGSQHIFEYLVDSLSLAIRLWVIGQIVDQVSFEGRVQLLPKQATNCDPRSEIIIFGTPCKHNMRAM
jgi:hypothetical protein